MVTPSTSSSPSAPTGRAGEDHWCTFHIRGYPSCLRSREVTSRHTCRISPKKLLAFPRAASAYHCSVAKTRTKPHFLAPMAAQQVRELPDGPEWLYEPKLDGYRSLLLKDADQVHLISRNDRDLTATYPVIVAAVR